MTLIAWNVQPDSVEILTDTLAYNGDASVLGYVSKCLYWPHNGVAVATGGNHLLGVLVKSWITGMAAADVDELAGLAKQQLPDIWAEAKERLAPSRPTSSAVYLFGWSGLHNRFMGYSGTADGDWESSFDWKFEDVRWWNTGADMGPAGSASFALPGDPGLPPALERASTVEEWIELGKTKRADYGHRPIGKRVLIGGDLVLTHLDEHGASQTKIHTFDDTGDEWAQILAGSANPAAAPHKWTGVGRNEPCPCKSGRKYKHCHDPRSVAR